MGDQPLNLNNDKTFNLDHTYNAPGIYTVTVRVEDDDGGVGEAEVEVATNSVLVEPGENVTVTLSGVTLTFEGISEDGLVTIEVTSHPQGGLPPSQYRFLNTYYELTTTATYTGTIKVSFAYDESDVNGLEENLKLFHWLGSGWVNITDWVDTENNVIYGLTTSLSPFAVGDLLNQPPTVDTGGPYEVTEGGEVEVTAMGTDPDNGPLTYTWDMDGDNSFEISGQAVIFSAADLDGPSEVVIRARVTDEGGLTAEAEAVVVVHNAAPVLSEISAPVEPQLVGQVIVAFAEISDPGSLDTHTAIFDWGDDTTSEGTVSGAIATGNHIYVTPGVYEVSLLVTDNDGAQVDQYFHYVVIYNPMGGFVTGGGWINSPLGALTLNPTLIGKANFGFVSKYEPGANVPTGNTKFQFKVGNLNFDSTSYDWLVVAGANAKYKGSGTINGVGDYGFMLTAKDGNLLGDTDKFRIKIWDKDSGITIYDNQMGAGDTAEAAYAIGAGSIVIHR